LPANCQQLLRSLEQATARLASLDRNDTDQVQGALAERGRAIDAVQGWIAAERLALRPVRPEIAGQLTRDLEAGAGILVRLALDRDATRLDLMTLNRAQQVLRGPGDGSPSRPTAIDCRG
jgi:hypothetical protein